jgi:hypothetical protein
LSKIIGFKPTSQRETYSTTIPGKLNAPKQINDENRTKKNQTLFSNRYYNPISGGGGGAVKGLKINLRLI